MNPSPLLYLHTYSLRFHLQFQPRFDVFTFIDRAAAEGFSGVCISANGPGLRHLGGGIQHSGGNDAGRFAEIKSHLSRFGLLCDIDTSGTEPSHLKRMLGIAALVGAQGLRTYTRYQGPLDQIMARTVDDLRAAAPAAAEFGIRIMLENHETFTGKEIASILKEVDHPWIGALFDYGNSQMVMEEPQHALAAMAPYTMAAHLKDHVMLRPDQSPDGRLSVLGVPIGEGYLPILALTRGLLTAGCHRIAFESSWGYRSAVKPERLTLETKILLGRGAFGFAQPPLANERYLLEPEVFSPDQLVSMEEEAYHRSLTWLKRELATMAEPATRSESKMIQNPH